MESSCCCIIILKTNVDMLFAVADTQLNIEITQTKPIEKT